MVRSTLTARPVKLTATDGGPSTHFADTPDIHRLLVDSITDYAIFAFDPKGCVLSWNSGAQRLKGYEASEVIGRSISTFYSRRSSIPSFRSAAVSRSLVKARDWGSRSAATLRAR